MAKFSDGTNYLDLHPDAKGFIENPDGTVEIQDAEGNVLPVSQADIDAERARGEAAIAASLYQRARANEYPSIGAQLDMLYHAIDADANLQTQFADFYAAIKAVKDANPKPAE